MKDSDGHDVTEDQLRAWEGVTARYAQKVRP